MRIQIFILGFKGLKKKISLPLVIINTAITDPFTQFVTVAVSPGKFNATWRTIATPSTGCLRSVAEFVKPIHVRNLSVELGAKRGLVCRDWLARTW